MDTPIWVMIGWLVIFGLRITGLVGAISGIEMFFAGIPVSYTHLTLPTTPYV